MKLDEADGQEATAQINELARVQQPHLHFSLFRWNPFLESGEFATIAELAKREEIAPSYMTGVLRLTLLAPDIVKAILGGRQGLEVTLARVLEPFPVEWVKQRHYFE